MILQLRNIRILLTKQLRRFLKYLRKDANQEEINNTIWQLLPNAQQRQYIFTNIPPGETLIQANAISNHSTHSSDTTYIATNSLVVSIGMDSETLPLHYYHDEPSYN